MKKKIKCLEHGIFLITVPYTIKNIYIESCITIYIYIYITTYIFLKIILNFIVLTK